jgi:hypothetical protein
LNDGGRMIGFRLRRGDMFEPFIWNSNSKPRNKRRPLENPRFDSYFCDWGESTYLNITLRVWLERIEPKTHGKFYLDADSQAFEIDAWSPDGFDWSFFKLMYFEAANEGWDKKLWIRPPRNYRELDYPKQNPSYRPNVACRFTCFEASSRADAHIEVDVVKIDPNKKANQGKSFRSHMFALHDLSWGEESHPVPKGGPDAHQVAIAHEVGHALGLDHVGNVWRLRSCLHPTKTTPKDACYGAASDAEAWMSRNIMGMGDQVDTFNAEPWINRAAKHTGTTAYEWGIGVWPPPPSRLVRDI